MISCCEPEYLLAMDNRLDEIGGACGLTVEHQKEPPKEEQKRRKGDKKMPKGKGKKPKK
jgi:hypothetical protein